MSLVQSDCLTLEQAAEDLYGRLSKKLGKGGKMTYVAEDWLEGLLKPLGYERTHQSTVSHALKLLGEQGLVRRSSVRTTRGYQASRRRDYPRPREVDITVLR